MHTQKASYAEWLSDRRESATLRPLTVDEQRAFENGYRANARDAVALARAVAGVGRKQATDIVHGAIGRMTYAVLQNKKSVPETAAAFRSWFLAYVRNVALKVGAAPELSGRKVPERELRADMDAYDAPPRKDTGAPWAAPKRTTGYGPCWPKPDRVELAEDLDFIIESACEMLSEQQSLVIECLFEGPRDIVSRVLGVAPKTVDTHTARAYAKLRKILLGFVWIVPNGDGRPPGTHWSEWNARFASMEARRQRRLAKAAERRKAA